MSLESGRTNITAERLFDMPDDGSRYELVNGVLHMMSPAGSEHGDIASRILRRLGDHVERCQLGKTYAAETGFLIASSPDTVRAPDAAFVSDQRLATVEPTRGYLPLAPDLVVEVISPSDSYSDVEAEATDWLNAGTLVVLVADPANAVLKSYEPTGIRTYRKGDVFQAGSACSGWQLSVDDALQIRD
jgi:Uma2 family endonuclease